MGRSRHSVPAPSHFYPLPGRLSGSNRVRLTTVLTLRQVSNRVVTDRTVQFCGPRIGPPKACRPCTAPCRVLDLSA
jgi:hypothetical protein